MPWVPGISPGTPTADEYAAVDAKIAGIATGATANSSDAFLLARPNQTGTQLADTISDSTAAGRAMLTAATAAAQTALLDAFTSAVKGLVPASGGGIVNFLRADGTWGLPGVGGGVSDGDKGDITVSVAGTVWTIDPGAVTLAKQADMATASVVYRKTAAAGAPEVQTLATLKTDLGLTGTNSGDQTTIVGITGTKAQFNTAVSDGDPLYVGDVTSNATHTGDVTGATALTIAADAVTYAKMQNVAAASLLLGRGSAGGAGDVQEIAVGTGLTMSGTTLSATGGAGAWTTVFQAADQLVTNSAVLVDATDLQFTTVLNTNYHIRLRVFFNSGNATADIKYRVTHGGTQLRVRRVRTYSVPAGTSATFPTVLPTAAFDTADQTLLASVVGDSVVYEDIYFQALTAGVFKIAFAQNTATAVASVTLLEGSYLEYATT